jgi:hypothetical protein
MGRVAKTCNTSDQRMHRPCISFMERPRRLARLGFGFGEGWARAWVQLQRRNRQQHRYRRLFTLRRIPRQPSLLPYISVAEPPHV